MQGGIPPELRAAVWAALLGVRHADGFLLDQAIMNTTKDLENQRIIAADAGTDLYTKMQLQTRPNISYCHVQLILYVPP